MHANEEFQSLVSGIEYPMYLVTAAAGGLRAGCLVGFATQASIDPPRMLVLLSKANHTYRVAQDAEELVVHFLGESDAALARLFGEQTSDEVDKFAQCEWSTTPRSTPVLRGTRGWMAGPILSRVDTGDHVAHLIGLDGATYRTEELQLGFQAVRDLRPGHPA